MLTVEEWAGIRRLHFVERLSKRAIARRLGITTHAVSDHGRRDATLPARSATCCIDTSADPWTVVEKARSLLSMKQPVNPRAVARLAGGTPRVQDALLYSLTR